MVIKNIHSLDEINMVCILYTPSELDLEPGAAIWQLTKNFDLLSHYRTFPWTSYYDRGGRTNAWSSNTIKLHLWNWTRKWLKKYGFLIPSSRKKSAPQSTQWQSLTVCFTFTKMAPLFTVWGWINVKLLNKISVNLENDKLKTIYFLVVSYRKIWIHWAVCHIIRFVFTPTSKFKFYYLTVAPIL